MFRRLKLSKAMEMSAVVLLLLSASRVESFTTSQRLRLRLVDAVTQPRGVRQHHLRRGPTALLAEEVDEVSVPASANEAGKEDKSVDSTNARVDDHVSKESEASVNLTSAMEPGSDHLHRSLLEAKLEIEENANIRNREGSIDSTQKKTVSPSTDGALGAKKSVPPIILPDTKEAGSSLNDAETELDIASKRKSDRKLERRNLIRSEGGIFAFDTKFGALNPFAIYYGLVSILLGVFWFFALTICDIIYFITGNRFDRMRRIPVFINHIWGTLLMRFSHCYPEMENREILMNFYKQNRAAMFVANHNSWMDIPFMGATIGWRNYKIVAKKELENVPILGRAIKCAKNVVVDRSDRRSQLQTLKAGMQWLKDGVHLCTFPEGTRSRSGCVLKFKNGAFKMAYKMNAPIIPLSIVASGKVMPSHWLFPFRPAHGVAKVVVHEPVETEGKSEEELANAARDAIISGLPADQRPEK